MRAAKDSERAQKAEAASTGQLWDSYLAQARAIRLVPEAGRHEKIFNVVSNAAAIRKNAALRSEAIAGLALSDLEINSALRPMPKNIDLVELDGALERYAYGNTTGEVFVCRMSDDAVLAKFSAQSSGPGTRLAVRGVVFSPDGGLLAARFAGGAVAVWDLQTQEQLLVSGADVTNSPIAGMTFWRDGKNFSFGDADAQGQITIFDLAEKKKIQSAIRLDGRPFRFRPGTMEVAVASDNRVDIFPFPGETPLQTLQSPTRIYVMAWSPDGTLLAASTEDGDIYLWDVVHHSQRICHGHSEPCVRLAFSPDGQLLASGSRDGTTRLWETAQGQNLLVATEGIASLFSRDGRRIGYYKLTASNADGANSKLTTGYGVWQLAASEGYDQLACPKSEGAFLSVDLSPSGRWCIATQSRGVRIWDLKNGARENFFPGTELQSVRMTPDETALFVCNGKNLERWPFLADEGGVKIDPSLNQVVELPDGKGARAIALSLDGKWGLVELSDLRLAMLNLASNAPPVFLAASSRQASLRTPASPTGAGRFAISPDGRWAVTGFGIGEKDRPMVWDAQTGKLVTALDFGSAVVVFSPDGRRLGTAGPANFAVWSVGDWQLLNKFDRDETGVSQGSMAFRRDSDEIAVTRTRQLAQLRDGLTNTAYADLISPQPQSVNSIRMSLDGSVLVTASATDKLQVWHLDVLRKKLAALHLDWRMPESATGAKVAVVKKNSSSVKITLIASLVGFGLAALFALASLRRHRMAITSYLAAEARSAQRNREFEIAKVELMHSQKMQALGTLATGIAHDFNNLLSVIRMSNKLIGRETKSNQDIQENVADIESAVMQGKGVVSSMLGYARHETDAAGPVDLSVVVEETVSLLSKEFLSGLALTLELDREAAKVNVRRSRVEQLLLNLIVNASEAMQGKGKLKITLHQLETMPARRFALRPAAAEHFIELTVADSGPGIAVENQLRIFEPFFTTKRSGAQAGTGLGLSLVHTIAQQDGLGLSVASELNQGAVFSILIPVSPQTPPVRETHSSQNPALPYAGGANDGNRK